MEFENVEKHNAYSDSDSDSKDILILQSKKKLTNLKANCSNSSDEEIPVTKATRVKKRIKMFSDSDDENGLKISSVNSASENEMTVTEISTANDTKLLQSNSGSDCKDIESIKNEQQQLRMKNKRTKLREKFKSLISTREKEINKSDTELGQDNKKTSEDSDDDSVSMNIIKEKIKEKMSFIPSVCDPDTSSDEENKELEKVKLKVSKQNKKRKSTQPTSPKPIRITAKIAMENMQKIKSESNRMLREKQVSLPYHRPKALSLKDILSRRKTAISQNGKNLPIKMNEEQLKQYAQQLEQRQKEMMELCKSDSEDENGAEDKNEIVMTENNAAIYSDKLSAETDNQTNETESFNSDKIKDPSDGSTLHDNSVSIGNEEMSVELNAVKETHCLPIAQSETFIEYISSTTMKNSENVQDNDKNKDTRGGTTDMSNVNTGTEKDSQLISLHFDTENNTENINIEQFNNQEEIIESKNDELFDDYFENDINMINIEKIMNNAELNKDNTQSHINIALSSKDEPLSANPKLTGTPGMVIDLDDNEPMVPKKLSGIELLKERFTYFAKLKTPEEKERDRERRIKPGASLMKLKQELEEEIAEQRSLEWAKRLEDERNHESEMKALRGETSDVDDEVEKNDKLAENVEKEESSSSEEEEDLIEDDVDMTDKAKKKNVFVTDEAEESECENDGNIAIDDNDANNINGETDDNESDINEDDESDDSSESSEEEESTVGKKSRILKAFEDSDDEDNTEIITDLKSDYIIKTNNQPKRKDESQIEITKPNETLDSIAVEEMKSQKISDSQDDVIQLAQAHRSISDEVFTSLESVLVASDKNRESDTECFYSTQTFSILKPMNTVDKNEPNNEDLSKSDTQSLHNCKDLKQCFGPSQLLNSQNSQGSSQPIGDDILALCTGNFYENEFVSQYSTEDISRIHFLDDITDKSQMKITTDKEKVNIEGSNHKINDTVNTIFDKANDKIINTSNINLVESNHTNKGICKNEDGKVLESILEELHDPEFDAPKLYNYFPGNTLQESTIKKKLVIDSDDEDNKTENIMSKKRKKKKLDKRALQFSDDEDEELEAEDAKEFESEIDEDDGEEKERIVEYDSEENEVEVKVSSIKKKRKATEFFENEAELTSEDEWIGSGDEDEAGLDRMEREEGDDETFNQSKLQKELGQIHMRDVMDQDKREVRIIQELLFEDGDLGDGHRQRKFRWRNTEDDEQMGTIVGEYTDTQEEEFESEEQWRKQRHEREIFLKQMQNKDEKEDLNITIDRTTIIKANLCSKTMSTLLQEMKKTDIQKTDEKCINSEKKVTRDIPSPKKAFSIFQQNYQGSLLTRGNGALARLAALATPLANDEDTSKIGSLIPANRRNFVFASVTADEEPKATKRKADTKPDTPRLMKKLKTDKQKISKNSLLDHLNV